MDDNDYETDLVADAIMADTYKVVPIYENWREVGGWITSSLGGTQYPTQQEAESVNLIRGLGGEVVNADRYLTPPTPQ